MHRFCFEITQHPGTLPPKSDGGNRPPDVMFHVEPDCPVRMTAEPQGARIECVLCDGGDTEEYSLVRITTAPPLRPHLHIADIRVYAGGAVGDDRDRMRALLVMVAGARRGRSV